MNTKYAALLRGINVGGNHKVPMLELKKVMTELGFRNVETLLNSGNVIFEAAEEPSLTLEKTIEDRLLQVFGFPVPVLLRSCASIHQLLLKDPFRDVQMSDDIRLYVSFLKEVPETNLTFPWSSPDGSYQILDLEDRTICSVLDLSINKTPKAMDALEQLYGKNITTRNWNTILRIAAKCGK